ncbi:hypothetical protein NFI96_009540 [Prochilodus magdalenae]|nr:hypothetical protein NFI96_009540 [Prochilodus magdalenae]
MGGSGAELVVISHRLTGTLPHCCPLGHLDTLTHLSSLNEGLDPSLSLLLHDKLQVPSSPRKAWNERESRCDVCSTHLSQLKQEAVHMVLTLDQCDLSPGSPPSLASLGGPRSVQQGPSPPRDWTYLPYHPPASNGSASNGSTPCSPHHLNPKHGPKPSSLGVGSGLDRKVGSPGHANKPTGSPSPHLPTSPNNSSAGPPQTHTHLEGMWSPAAHLSRANGVTLYPCQRTADQIGPPPSGLI